MTVQTKLLALVLWLRSQSCRAAVTTALRRVGALEASQLADSLDNANSSQLDGLLDAAFTLLLDSRRVAELRKLQAERNRLAKQYAARLRKAKRLAECCLSAALSSGYSLSLGTAGLALCAMRDESEAVDLDAAEDEADAQRNLGLRKGFDRVWSMLWKRTHKVERTAAGKGLNAVERNIRALAVALESGYCTPAELDGLRAKLWRYLHGNMPQPGAGCGLPTPAVVTGPDALVEMYRNQPAKRLVSGAAQLALPEPQFGVGFQHVRRVELPGGKGAYRIELLQQHELFAPPVLSGLGCMPKLWAWTERYPELYPGDAACYCVGRAGTPAHPRLHASKAAPYRSTAATAPAAQLPNWEHVLDELNRLCGTAPGLLAHSAREVRDELRRWVGRGRKDFTFTNAVRTAHHFLRYETARMGRWGEMYGRKVLAQELPKLAGFVPVQTGGQWCCRRGCDEIAQYRDYTRSNRILCQSHAIQVAAKLAAKLKRAG